MTGSPINPKMPSYGNSTWVNNTPEGYEAQQLIGKVRDTGRVKPVCTS